MRNQRHRVVIVGAGLAGARTALSLRDSGYEGEVVLVGDEAHLPYERPMLSKDILRGQRTFDDLLVAPADQFVQNSVNVVTGTSAIEIDVPANAVVLGDGTRLTYSDLVLATGATARPLCGTNSDLAGMHTLRTYDDALRIVAQSTPGTRCAVVGLGLIGSEVAATLRNQGLDVIAIEPAAGPMWRILGADVSATIADLHRSAGVELRLQTSVDSVLGASRVRGIRLSDGTTVDADIVVTGLGAIPNITLAANAGIPCNRGILTNSEGRTAVSNIFAVGDAAETNVQHVGRPVIREHWQAAIKQAARVAAVIAGASPEDETVAWFWSDQYDKQIQVIGYPAPGDGIVIRGRLDELDYIAFHLRGGAVVAASAVGRGRELRRTSGLIRAGTICDREALLDDRVDVQTLAIVG